MRSQRGTEVEPAAVAGIALKRPLKQFDQLDHILKEEEQLKEKSMAIYKKALHLGITSSLPPDQPTYLDQRVDPNVFPFLGLALKYQTRRKRK